METFTMSRKELPRAGLVAAALAGRISNREGAAALQLTPRQFQRLKLQDRYAGFNDTHLTEKLREVQRIANTSALEERLPPPPSPRHNLPDSDTGHPRSSWHSLRRLLQSNFRLGRPRGSRRMRDCVAPALSLLRPTTFG